MNCLEAIDEYYHKLILHRNENIKKFLYFGNIYAFFADARKPGYPLSAWKPGEYVTHCIRHVCHIKKIVNLQKSIGSRQLCAGVFMTGEKLGTDIMFKSVLVAWQGPRCAWSCSALPNVPTSCVFITLKTLNQKIILL